MKDFPTYSTEKPFFCNVDGCTMKFANEDHLTVHKKRHEMTLTLGLGSKSNTYTDQTPTPTQLIRKCEEVGLFRDLQNVNPFEETFKKALETVKSGQSLSVERPFGSNPPDDTLHTPNVFPYITDGPNLSHSDGSSRTEIISSCVDGILKHESSENEKATVVDILPDPTNQETVKSATSSSETSELSEDLAGLENHSTRENVIVNVPEGHYVQLITPDTPLSSCNMVVLKNSVNEIFPLSVKDKLKKSLNEKKMSKYVQQKIPITKCPSKQSKNSLSCKFSKFSKNAMKLISKLEDPIIQRDKSSEISHQKQKSEKGQKQESRSEFLARSRAASSRCREKKKMYILYLEKVNKELSVANKNFQMINNLLQKEICDLHLELLKHKNCSASDEKTAATISSTESFIGQKNVQKEGITETLCPEELPHQELLVELSPSLDCDNFEISHDNSILLDPNSFLFDVAEVVLDDGKEDSKIPLTEDNKPPDIIVRFNSVGNDFPSNIPLDVPYNRCIEAAGNGVKQIYSEHSYYLKKPLHLDKRVINYKTFEGSFGTVSPIDSDECEKLNSLNVKKIDAFTDITTLNTKVLLEPRTPPPLLLLKPFKKRTLENKHIEES